MNKSKMIVRTKFIDRACHWTVVIWFFWWRLRSVLFPTLQWADGNLRYAADGAHFASLLRRGYLHCADVYVCTLCPP